MRGHVRYEVTRHNLAATLGEFLNSPRRIIDIGGGRGSDARWLAAMPAGHKVILVEPDETFVADAMQVNNGEIDVVRGTADTAAAIYAKQSFDLVLSHGVLMYLPDPQAELAKLAALTRPGGYISLLNANLLGKLNRYQSRGNQQMVDRLRLSGYYQNNLGQKARAFLPQEFEHMLSQAGLEAVDWFGVRIKSDDDTRQTDEVPTFHRNRAVDEEIRLSRDKTTRPQGQLLHYIAKKLN